MVSTAPEDCLIKDQTILNYCVSGNLESLKKCQNVLSRVVHNTFPDGQTCLIAACRNGNREVVEFLVDVCGADVEQAGVVEFESEQVEGVPPLWCAAAAGHLPVIESLIARGADVNRTTITNSTALRAACFDGHEEVVRYLVQHGANVEIPNRHGHTCLMISCYRRRDRIVEFLLAKNARVNRRSAKGNTALHDCAESGNLKGLQILLEHGAILRSDEYGQSPIMSGANAAFKKIVDYLASFNELQSNSPHQASPISIHEKIAAYELLGASLFDRHSLVQDAIAAWFQAFRLRHVAGTYPKRSPTSNTQCPCSVTSPPVSAPISTLSKSPFVVRSNAETAGPNWSLVDMAAREAVYLTESTYPNTYTRTAANLPGSQFNSKPVSYETYSAHNLYEQKRNRLQSELYSAYTQELDRLGFTGVRKCETDESCLRPVARLPNMLSISTDNANIPSPIASFHPVIGLVHPATPADPLRCIEPPCWPSPRYRRWPLNCSSYPYSRSSYHPSPSTLSSPARPLSSVQTCRSCGQRVILFGSRLSPFTGYLGCTPCSSEQVVPTHGVTTLSSEGPPVETSPIQTDHPQTAHLFCHSCRLASETHPLICRLRQFGEEAFGHVREFATEEELTELMRNAHALRLQPLLIRLRILGPDHLDTIYFIRYRGAIYADTDNFRQCLNLWRYALELQRVFLEPLCHVSQAAFASFAELFQFVLNNNYSGLPAVDLDPTLIVDCLELAVDSVERGMDYSFYQWYRRYPWSYSTADKEAINLMRHVALCLHFIAMILTHYLPDPDPLPVRGCQHQSIQSPSVVAELSSLHTSPHTPDTNGLLSPSQPDHSDVISRRMYSAMSLKLRQRFLVQAYRLVRLDPRVHDGHSLIHLACSLDTSTVGRFLICHFPNLPVLSLLFQLGADPNCVDVHGQRPLLSVLSQRRLQVTEQASLVVALVRNGAHLDAANSDGLTALDPRFRHILSQSGVRPLEHISLRCQAARVARRAGLNERTSGHFLPNDLWSFIDMH